MGMAFTRRWISLLLISFVFLFSLLHLNSVNDGALPEPPKPPPTSQTSKKSTLDYWWKHYVTRYPVTSMIPLPTQKSAPIPQIQFKFPREDAKRRAERLQRLNAVKEAFLHTWKGYKEKAWGHDELDPVNGKFKSTFGGWGATLVDSLDTLWIMGLKEEFAEAVAAAAKIDFTTSEQMILNVFETTIRYLGGFIAAYDLSEGAYPVLLEKAKEVADMLYVTFDTPKRMPVLRWNWKDARDGESQETSASNIVSELGSLAMEFTRMTQLTGDPKYYDAIARITNVLEEQQDRTKLPGLFPVDVDSASPDFSSDDRFTLGAMADSLYEYLPKEHLMLGGRTSQYKNIYNKAIDAAKKHLFFRPKTNESADILISGSATASSLTNVKLKPEGQHLTCFAGGMAALGAKTFERPGDLEIGRKLTEGCIWAYRTMPTGIMPELFTAVPCEDYSDCSWSPRIWYRSEEDAKLTMGELEKQAQENGMYPGFRTVNDARYLLRPEAIESVFILYRITGDRSFQDSGWDMFRAVNNYTKTALAHGAIHDVRSTNPIILTEMESFWTGETLKYFYLLFSEPNLISLDKYVFNTEAHPFKMPVYR